jgi:pyruvate-ferredoxin/flavodoxin oxidoreductase
MLIQADEARAQLLMEQAREDVTKRWNLYRQMAEIQYKTDGQDQK